MIRNEKLHREDEAVRLRLLEERQKKRSKGVQKSQLSKAEGVTEAAQNVKAKPNKISSIAEKANMSEIEESMRQTFMN